MARVLRKWLGVNPTANQLDALIKAYQTADRLESYLCQICMFDTNERRYNWFMAWLKDRA